MYKLEDKYILTKHPFKSVILEGCHTLIIGMFPAHRREFEFYYSGSENRFWQIVSEVFKYKFAHSVGQGAVNERRKFAESQKIGFADMHELCYRKNNLSGDDNLYSVKLLDIFDILKKVPSINMITLTSRTEGVGALGLLKILMMQKNEELPEFTKLHNGILKTYISYENRTIDVYVPFSPSARTKTIPFRRLVEMYNYVLST